MFAYAMLGAAVVMAVYLLSFKKKDIERKEMDLCDNLTYVGLAFDGIGNADGSYLGEKAWGHYWAWDPKRHGRQLLGSPIWYISISAGQTVEELVRH